MTLWGHTPHLSCPRSPAPHASLLLPQVASFSTLSATSICHARPLNTQLSALPYLRSHFQAPSSRNPDCSPHLPQSCCSGEALVTAPPMACFRLTPTCSSTTGHRAHAVVSTQLGGEQAEGGSGRGASTNCWGQRLSFGKFPLSEGK